MKVEKFTQHLRPHFNKMSTLIKYLEKIVEEHKEFTHLLEKYRKEVDSFDEFVEKLDVGKVQGYEKGEFLDLYYPHYSKVLYSIYPDKDNIFKLSSYFYLQKDYKLLTEEVFNITQINLFKEQLINIYENPIIYNKKDKAELRLYPYRNIDEGKTPKDILERVEFTSITPSDFSYKNLYIQTHKETDLFLTEDLKVILPVETGPREFLALYKEPILK